MIYLTGLIIGIFVFIGSFHLYWVFGGRIGLDMVIPTKANKPMFFPGKIATLCVAVLVFGFALVFYVLQFSEGEKDVFIYLAWGISGLFLLRAIGEFNAVGFFKKIKDSRFARYDTRFFSPLCLFLALSSAIVTYQA